MDTVIIGAPRSGTNMLRDVLAQLPGFATWPCDEINYIWRHGNVRFPSDEIPAEEATQKVKNYIRQNFNLIKYEYGADVVVEKTCANSLRVPFVDAVLPEAKFIFIYRDGIDATGSAKERWVAKLDIPYILKKARFVPKMDLPYYAFRYFGARLHRFRSGDKRLAFWGPVLDGMPEILHRHTLNEICALQWQRCVDKAEQAFSAMTPDKVIRVCYEDFVQEPSLELSRILQFIGKDFDSDLIERSVKNVSPLSLGKGRRVLGEVETAKLESLVGETLKRYGYL